MEKTTIKVKRGLAMKLNKLKYSWQVKSLNDVIEKLIEICEKKEVRKWKTKLNYG